MPPPSAPDDDPELGSPSSFPISRATLRALFAARDASALAVPYGGPAGLARNYLRSDPVRGISGGEYSHVQKMSDAALDSEVEVKMDAGKMEELMGEDGMGARREAFGTNRFEYPPPKSYFRLLAGAFQDVTLIILCVAAVVSLTIGLAVQEEREHYGYVEGIAIIAVVVVVSNVQAGIDYSKEKKFRQLNSVRDNYTVCVVRSATVLAVPAETIVVGDVIRLMAGDKLPADCLLLTSDVFKTDESAMTGESIEIPKSPDRDPFLISGTTVGEGCGDALVIAVGLDSEWGQILAQLIVEPENTPLQDRLDRLAINIGWFGIVMATLTFVVSMIRWIVDGARSGNWNGNEVLTFFIDAVTIVVVAIPEGLPLAITLGLAFAMRKMMEDMNLVRRLEACETMGSATQLNADKTGTLTQNRMTVVEAYFAGQSYAYMGESLEPGMRNAQQEAAELSQSFKLLVAQSMSVNTKANLHRKDDGSYEHIGSKTECALLQHVQQWGMEYTAIRMQNPSTKIYLFDSTKKRMSTLQAGPRPGVQRLHTKGAPEVVIKLCDSYAAADGSTVMFAPGEQILIQDRIESMAKRGLRTLLLAYRDIDRAGPDVDKDFWEEAPEHHLTLLGIVGIKDPIRPESKEAVLLLRGAGVTVRMVTGDNVLTARFIAEEVGILDPAVDGPNAVIEGPVFRKMSKEDKARVALDIRVLARSTPTDKLMLVRQHKRLGEVVAVTGDGTNDAPALKEADVGFALGLEGTETAKESCDIVILDDNIKSMARAVLWGRNVYQSIRKFLQFQLVVNVVAVSLNFISACAGVPLPLSAVPLLWVNMIMDSMGALALATEPPRMELMERKPFGRYAPLINRAMFRNIIGMSIYQLTVCLVLQFVGEEIFNIPCFPTSSASPEDILEHPCSGTTLELNSVIFNTFVFMQIFSEINSRRIAERDIFSGIFKSYYFCLIIVVTIAVQCIIMFAVAGTTVGDAVGFGTITGAEWGACILLGVLTLPVGFITRLVPLECCFGPLDEDVEQMSRAEQFLHLPRRKAPHFEGIIDEDPDDVPSLADPSAAWKMDDVERVPLVSQTAKMRFRVFVHAVAFVNAVKESSTADKRPVKLLESQKKDK